MARLADSNAATPQSTSVPMPSTSTSELTRLRTVLNDYLMLTKPGIISLLLITMVGAMMIAERGMPSFGLLLASVVGGYLASGGANALNCYIDRDIDKIMPRTRHRGTASGRISPRAALIFGFSLTILAMVVLGVFVNPLAAVLALAGNVYYVVIYTKWLKRRTPQNIVIGGAAGSFPPLVGWAAVTGDLSWIAWGLFAIIFLWTPPHFWSLALLKQGEYGRAHVPMLPVVAGERTTRHQILLYTILLTIVGAAMTPLGFGWIYLGGTLMVNMVFLRQALMLNIDPSKKNAREMFFFSLWYLTLYFVIAVVDRLILV